MVFNRFWFACVTTVLYIVLGILAIASNAAADDGVDRSDATYQPKSKAELRRSLTRLQYRVTQEAETEPAFRNAYWDNKREGAYHCIVCDQLLFDSSTKFKSGTGWPSFWKPVDDQAVGTKVDWKMIVYPRTEVHCSRCEAHLGHVFKDGPPPTGLRYCMNSASLKFVPAEETKKEEEPSIVQSDP